MGLWARLRSALSVGVSSMGGPAPVALLAEGESRPADLMQDAIGDLPISEQFSRIGGSLTPARVGAILASADLGQIARFVDLVHESRQKDGHFQCIMQGRELAVLRLPWGLQLTEPSVEEQAALDACKMALKTCATFPSLMAHLNGESLLFGHATSEDVWRIGEDEDDPALKGLLIPGQFKNLSCHRFGFRRDDGALLFDKGGTGDVSRDGVDLLATYPAGKFVQQRRRVNGDVPIREGLGRVLVWFSLFRNWTLRDWLQLAEMAYKPWRIGKYEKDRTTKTDRDILWRVLQRITTRGVAVLPDSTKLDIQWPEQRGVGDQSVHRELAEYLGQEMSKAVLGGTLTSEAGSKGARSLGNVHERVARQLRDADALELAATIQTHVIKPFYQYNYGTKYRVPLFYLNCDEVVDFYKFTQGLLKLVEAGDDRIPTDWVHEKTGMPTATEGQATLRLPETIPDENDEDEDEDDNEGDEDEE